ncbi:MAG: type I restriction-modification system subunit M N-terminal domain-containing protein [Rhizobiaceae bacterium]
MYEAAFNAIERQLRAEDGIANELDYVEQISWVLFLKYLDDLESERRDLAELKDKDYTPSSRANSAGGPGRRRRRRTAHSTTMPR